MKWGVIAVVLVLVASACGTSERDQGVADLLDLGFSQAEAECVVDGVIEEIGSLSRLDDDDVSAEEVDRAAAVFEQCAAGSVGRVDEPTRVDEPSTPPADPGDDAAAPVDSALPGGDALPGAGHWTAAELCLLVPQGILDPLFSATNPITAQESTDQPEWSVCKWEDPDVEFDPAVSTPQLFTIKNIPRDTQNPRSDIEQVDLGLTAPDGAVYYEEFNPGMAAIVVFAGDQLLQISYPVGTTGAKELSRDVASVWVEAQLGTPGSSDSGESVDDAAAQGESVDDAAAPMASDGPPGDDPELDELWAGCADADPDACDRLFLASPLGSAYEDFGLTCGNRRATNCTELLGDANGSFTPDTPAPPGDAELVGFWNECAAGDADACNALFIAAPAGSDFEYYGQSCGGRGMSFDCEVDIANYSG